MLAGTAHFIIAAVGGLLSISYMGEVLICIFILIGLGMIAFGVGSVAAVKFRSWR